MPSAWSRRWRVTRVTLLSRARVDYKDLWHYLGGQEACRTRAGMPILGFTEYRPDEQEGSVNTVRSHRYELNLRWTGNLGTGTSGYREFSRAHAIDAEGKPTLYGSADPAFRGDASQYNPEDLLVAALSACHMLWFLHLCAERRIVVEAYEDRPQGVMVHNASGGGRFDSVELKPHVVFADPTQATAAEQLHHTAHERCFIANSVNFPVTVTPTLRP